MTASGDAKHPAGSISAAEAGSIRAHAVRGAAWMTGLQWAVRALGIASTAVLARLLTPADFGVMAMAALSMAVIAMFGVSGQDLALIRMGRPSRDYFDSAWTVEVIVGILLFGLAVASAPIAGMYFHSEKVELVIYVISFRLLLEGFTNIGLIFFRIDLDFAKEFRYFIYRKLCSVVLGVLCVLILRNFWGLAIAVVLSKAADVMLSYRMHPFRPRFRLNKAREIWSYSSWMLVVTHGRHFAARADEYVVGAISSAGVMGAYNVGADIAVTPTVDLVEPVTRALFPVYSRLLSDPERLRAAALLVIAATATVCLATGPGVAGTARELTLLLLGPQWKEAASLVFWFGIGAIPVGMRVALYAIFEVTGHLRLTAVAVWARLAVLIPTLLIAGRWGGASAIAEAQAVLGVIALAGDCFVLRRAIRVSLADVVSCLYRPVAAALAMVCVLGALDRAMQLPLAASLAVKIAAGAAAYVGALTLVWLLARRPDGIEAVAFASAAKTLRRCLGR
ncbi:MAG TPA: oligosaccharide flippase family protein [Stellaceae bacterium]|jgi:O-antigen/teichoic acid export membrane protein